MRSRFKLIVLALGVIGFKSAFALLSDGNEVGNGGNAVACGTKTELLDLYEAKVLRNFTPDKSIKGTAPFSIALERLEKLSQIDPQAGKTILGFAKKLQSEISFEKEIKLKPIDDSKHSFEPSEKNCKIEQLAVLRKKVLPGEKRVLVNEPLWKKLPALHQAGLLIHESVYKFLAGKGEKDSVKSRYLVTFLLSDTFSGDNAGIEYWKLVKQLHLPIYR